MGRRAGRRVKPEFDALDKDMRTERASRKARKLTQARVAGKLGITQDSVAFDLPALKRQRFLVIRSYPSCHLVAISLQNHGCLMARSFAAGFVDYLAYRAEGDFAGDRAVRGIWDNDLASAGG